MVADESKVARESRISNGSARFNTEFRGGNDEAMNPKDERSQ